MAADRDKPLQDAHGPDEKKPTVLKVSVNLSKIKKFIKWLKRIGSKQ